MITRESLVQYKRGVLTRDTVEALRHLEMRAARLQDMTVSFNASSWTREEMKWARIRTDRPDPLGHPPEWSAKPTGRLVSLNIAFKDDPGEEVTRRERQLAVLWGLAVPLGFVPWNRYPLVGITDALFFYPGPWHPLMDSLMGQGRGEEVWPSFCAAAQVDVGSWEGNRPVERFVQAQLHRLGYHCGPIDGIIGNATEAAMRGSGYYGHPLTELAEKLAEAHPAEPPKIGDKVDGHVILPFDNFSIASYGQIRTVKTRQGASLDISGPGRVVIDVRGS